MWVPHLRLMQRRRLQGRRRRERLRRDRLRRGHIEHLRCGRRLLRTGLLRVVVSWGSHVAQRQVMRYLAHRAGKLRNGLETRQRIPIQA